MAVTLTLTHALTSGRSNPNFAQETADIEGVFDALDLDKSGTVDLREMKTAFRSFA